MVDFWVFGYGSLMWRPGFDALEAVRATLFGHHRTLCVYSWVHRGTKTKPGLVFGLDRGGACCGMAYRIANENRQQVLDYLRARELVTNVYLEVERPVRLLTGKKVMTTTYIVDPDHAQYAGKLSEDDLASQILGAVGQSGANEDYLFATLSHMRELNIYDHKLEKLANRINKSGYSGNY